MSHTSPEISASCVPLPWPFFISPANSIRPLKWAEMGLSVALHSPKDKRNKHPKTDTRRFQLSQRGAQNKWISYIDIIGGLHLLLHEVKCLVPSESAWHREEWSFTSEAHWILKLLLTLWSTSDIAYSYTKTSRSCTLEANSISSHPVLHTYQTPIISRWIITCWVK